MDLRRLSVLSSASILASVISSITPAFAQSIPPEVVKKLHDANWTIRAEAVEQLTSGHQVLQEPTTRRALIEQLNWENQLLRDPRRFKFASVAENEAWGRYYSMLLGQVDALVDPEDTRSVSILAQSAYNGDSPFAVKLACYGQTVAPALLAMTADPRFRESDVYIVLGYVLRCHHTATSKYPLTAETAQEVEDHLRAGLRSPVSSVRWEAIEGVKVAGDLTSLPVLEQLRTSDPYTAGPGKYLIREHAAEAIAAIQANPLSK